MNAAVWITQSVIDGRRFDREADATAHRQARDARQARSGHGLWLLARRPRRVDVPADIAAEAIGPLETVDDYRELAGAGRR